MRQISSAEAQRNFGTYRLIAEGGASEAEAVTVLHYNKPSVVILSATEYERLKRRDKQVLLTEELPEWLVERIAAAAMEPQFARLESDD